MATLTRSQAERFFSHFRPRGIASFRYTNTDHCYHFRPTAWMTGASTLCYALALIVPHLIFIGGRFHPNPSLNLGLYLFLRLGLGACVILMVWLSALRSVTIDTLLRRVEISFRDPLARFFRSPLSYSFDEIEAVEYEKVPTKTGAEYYILLKVANDGAVRTIVVSDSGDIRAVKAHFEALIRGSVEANHPEPRETSFEKILKKSLAEKEGETSYLPFIALCIAILSLVLGFILYFSIGSMRPLTALVDGMRPITLRWTGIAFGIYLVFLLIASQTPYQRRKKHSLQTVTVLGLLAFSGFYLNSSAIAHWSNTTFDHSPTQPIQAIVTDHYYSPGSKNSAGKYILVLSLNSSGQQIEMVHHRDDLRPPLQSLVNLQLHTGYLGKRWVRLIIK